MKQGVTVADRGLYAVTPTALTGPALLDAVAEVLAGGAVWLQYRAKQAADAETAAMLVACCRRANARLIVNDDPALARRVGADGVHLGRDDVTVKAAREIVGPDRLIGVSCYDDLGRAAEAAELGADYLAFGSMFHSSTKPAAVRCPLETLSVARGLGRPVVAIGGITADNAAAAISAGADLVAVIEDLFSAADRRARARGYARLFRDPSHASPGA
jgi:thiamine-phosphate pyrophosphorylase